MQDGYNNIMFDIDKIAVVKGAWFSLIDEMKLGVI